MSTPLLLQMQSPAGVPRSPYVTETNDPLLPPQNRKAMLAHFFEDIYNLDPESHLSRLLGSVLGDSGVGQLRKKVTYSHLSQVLLTSHYYDMDRLFADIFGLKRFLSEGLAFDPTTGSGTAAEWEQVIAADASYRNRVAMFVRGISWGPTPPGIALMASAICGLPTRVYETYRDLDAASAPDTPVTSLTTYGDLEVFSYGELEGKTYAELEGVTSFTGRNDRAEFILRPQGPITSEQRYHLIRVLNRLKPVNSMMSIDTTGLKVNEKVQPLEVFSPSEHWQVRSKVVVSDVAAYTPDYGTVSLGEEVERRTHSFGEHITEEWFYNGDVLDVSSHAVMPDGTVAEYNYERAVDPRTGTAKGYRAEDAVSNHYEVQRGRATRDGVLSAPMVVRS